MRVPPSQGALRLGSQVVAPLWREAAEGLSRAFGVRKARPQMYYPANPANRPSGRVSQVQLGPATVGAGFEKDLAERCLALNDKSYLP